VPLVKIKIKIKKGIDEISLQENATGENELYEENTMEA
jgi:hypothetical protein